MTADSEHLESTSQLDQARDLADIGRSLLITGRAGTGKSTLLRDIRQRLEERGRLVSVVAPTGIAALNVGGETFHRHFAFRQDLLPSLRDYRPPSHLYDLDVLIVDEISMVRADYFDMMSRSLCRAKNSRLPFGGVQLVLFGDLFQLPPVVTDRDMDLLADYKTSFFFSALAFQALDITSIELTQVFRQRNEDFIALLNAIREGNDIDNALQSLNARVVPEENYSTESVVSIVPTNTMADEVNSAELGRLGNPIWEHEAQVRGEISLRDYRVPAVLKFSIGAQVMMSTNSPDYANGSLGTVRDIRDLSSVEVDIQLAETGRTVTVTPHRWEIWRQTRKEAVLVGSIEQLPFRLAWAITVHRSQGQSFDRVLFDRGRGMFDSGQMYVALSRCRTLEGLYLKRPITERDVRVDPNVLRFYREATAEAVDIRQYPHAFVGFIETDAGEFGRLLEISICGIGAKGEDYRFCTLVNPMRDFEHEGAGLLPRDVTLAPTVDEMRPAVALLLNNRHVVCSRGNRLQDLLKLSEIGHEGLWVDVALNEDTELTNDALPSAAVHLEATKNAFMRQSHSNATSVPVSVSVANLPETLALVDRDGYSAVPLSLTETLALSLDDRILLHLAIEGGRPTTNVSAMAEIGALAGPGRLRAQGRRLINSLVKAAGRDGRVSEVEAARILEIAHRLGVDPPAIEASTQGVGQVPIWRGMRICLTGEPKGSAGSNLSKAALRRVLSAHDILEVDKVTASGCDLVVAFDATVQSRKTRAARNFKTPIPVISSQDLLDRLGTGPILDVSPSIVNPIDGIQLPPEPSAAQIRSWAKENGLPVAPRGRISAELRDAYRRAVHGA